MKSTTNCSAKQIVPLCTSAMCAYINNLMCIRHQISPVLCKWASVQIKVQITNTSAYTHTTQCHQGVGNNEARYSRRGFTDRHSSDHGSSDCSHICLWVWADISTLKQRCQSDWFGWQVGFVQMRHCADRNTFCLCTSASMFPMLLKGTNAVIFSHNQPAWN